MPKKMQEMVTPQEVINLLKESNAAFARGERRDVDFLSEQKQTAEAQHPGAIILSCIDSRAPAEIIFNLGIGDIFNARVAGNFVNDDIAGSLEFACKVAGAKLILVMGHSNCGAVRSACDDVEMGNITGMLAKLKPAVHAVTVDGERNSSNEVFVAAVAEKNIKLTVQRVRDVSPILREMEANGDIMIVGAMYDVATGLVEFYE